MSLERKLVEAAIDASEEVVEKVRNHLHNPAILAVVFDIDGTLIDEHDQPIRPIVSLYNFCKALKTSLFIVTAREESSREETHKELSRHGITDYVDSYFRHKHEYNVEKQKTQARKDIHDRGYDVVMSVGDMPWDIGKYGGYGVLLPTDNN